MKTNSLRLTPRQNNFVATYTDPSSPTFGNCYGSARTAGYSDKTARNLTHLNPRWLSESIGSLQAIEPEQITQVLTSVIYSQDEPTYIKLKALEMMMKYHSMLKQHSEPISTVVNLN